MKYTKPIQKPNGYKMIKIKMLTIRNFIENSYIKITSNM